MGVLLPWHAQHCKLGSRQTGAWGQPGTVSTLSCWYSWEWVFQCNEESLNATPDNAQVD